MSKLKQLMDCKGKRIRLWHRRLLIYWGLLLALPLILVLVGFHWWVTRPLLLVALETGWYVRPFILPLALTSFGIGMGILIPMVIIKNSIFNAGFFAKSDQIQALAVYLLDHDFIIRKQIVNGTKEKLKFPPVYYRRGIDMDTLTFRIGNQFHDRFLELGKTLEELYLADLIEIERIPKHVSYKLLVDTISKRIGFEEAKVENGILTLMQGVEWDFEAMPHMLITGGTGGGKTYFLYTLIALLGKIGRVHIADPKNSDLTHLGQFSAFKGYVASEKAAILDQMKLAVEFMEKRYKYMNEHPDQKMGQNYRYYQMPPEFFIVDEWGAFISTLDMREEATLYQSIAPLVLKARQCGVFLIIATQRAGTDVIKSMIRDNLMCKVSLGTLSPMGYEMTFGDGGKDKAFFNKPKVKGRGYIDCGNGIPQEFYAPHVPADFSFEAYFKQMADMVYLDVSSVVLTSDDRDTFKQAFESEKAVLMAENETAKRKKGHDYYAKKERKHQQLRNQAHQRE